ncbi:hypothetical protein IIA16_02880 [bacterium]|nr:hypothetical protein [bacterium]
MTVLATQGREVILHATYAADEEGIILALAHMDGGECDSELFFVGRDEAWADKVRLTDNTKADQFPTPIPGTSQLVFQRASTLKVGLKSLPAWTNWDFYLLDMATGEERRLTHQDYARAERPALSFGGEAIYVWEPGSYDAAGIFRLDIETLERREVINSPTLAYWLGMPIRCEIWVSDVTSSPWHRRLAFSVATRNIEPCVATGGDYVFLVVIEDLENGIEPVGLWVDEDIPREGNFAIGSTGETVYRAIEKSLESEREISVAIWGLASADGAHEPIVTYRVPWWINLQGPLPESDRE